MATTASPNGLRPVNRLDGLPYAGATQRIKVTNSYGTSIFYGDLVKLVAAGTLEKDTSTDAATPVGVFLGCEYTDPSLGYKLFRQYWPASTVATDIVAYVCSDPDAVFRIQANGTLAQTALGTNAAVVQTNGSTTTGNSAVALAYDSVNTTNTLPVRIVGFVEAPGSAVGDTYTDVLVKINTHQYRSTTGLA